jgi:Ser/Thr protein kinase RdoA (MazF antagonist)
MDWKQGVALGSIQQVTVSHLRSVGLALGQLHRIAKRWPIESSIVESVDYRMIHRHESLQQVVDTEFRKQQRILLKWNSFSKDSSPSESLLPLVIEALEAAIRVARPSVVAMKNLCCTASLRHWMHGDAWRGNWLFSGSENEGLLRVSGLIDFGQAGFRWPGFDFARAIGSMGWGQNTFWQEAWESYCQVLGETEYSLEEAMLMHRVSMVLTLVAYIDRMELGLMQDESAMDRLREVCLQLKSL